MSKNQEGPEPPPDWVNELAGCSPEDALRELAEVVETDTAKMDALPEALREGCGFRFEWGDQGVRFFSVTRNSPDMRMPDQAMTFSATPEEIVISTHAAAKPFRLKVRTEWNEKTGRRVLMVGDEEQELWQISCRALRDLFFGYQIGPAKRLRPDD